MTNCKLFSSFALILLLGTLFGIAAKQGAGKIKLTAASTNPKSDTIEIKVGSGRK